METSMKKFLIHNGGSRQYRSIIRHLQKHIPPANYVVNQLHNRIFDIGYITKPDVLIFPISEYTQEIHNYIEKNIKKLRPIFFIDAKIPQEELLKHLSDNNCSFIIDSQTEYILPNSITYKYIYDDHIFYDMNLIERNGKLAVSLGMDNERNTKLLKDILYPHITKYPMVLFNNPEFKYEQNIGFFNEPDLNYILNQFSYFMDLDNEFLLEAKVCNIPVLNETNDTDNAIDKKNYNLTMLETSIEEFKCSLFVENKLLDFLGIK